MKNVSKILAQEGLIGKTAAGRELGDYIHMWCDSIFAAVKSKLNTSKFAKPKKYYSGPFHLGSWSDQYEFSVISPPSKKLPNYKPTQLILTLRLKAPDKLVCGISTYSADNILGSNEFNLDTSSLTVVEIADKILQKFEKGVPS